MHWKFLYDESEEGDEPQYSFKGLKYYTLIDKKMSCALAFMRLIRTSFITVFQSFSKYYL